MRDYQHFLFFSDQIKEQTVLLDTPETNHAVKVLRLKPGDRFNVSNGDGTILTCSFDDLVDRQAHGTIVSSQNYQRSTSSIHLYIGMPDRDALETVLVNCTALGIEQITPVICDFCQDNWWEKSWAKHSERFRNKMIAAMKQSLYPFLPTLSEPVIFESASENASGLKIVAEPDGKPLYTLSLSHGDNPISCFIGPPGGFSKKELSGLNATGYQLVKIAPTRLRTELAAVVLCSQIIGQLLNQ